MKLSLALLGAVMALELKAATPTKDQVESAIKVADEAVLKLKSDLEEAKTKQTAEAAAGQEVETEVDDSKQLEQDMADDAAEDKAEDAMMAEEGESDEGMDMDSDSEDMKAEEMAEEGMGMEAEDSEEGVEADDMSESEDSEEIENPFLNQEFEAEEESDADLDREFDGKMESELDAEYDAEMEDTPQEELNVMMTAANTTSMSHLKVFAMGRYKKIGGACRGGNRRNGDDCTSRAVCRRGYVAVHCGMRGRGDGSYTSYRGRYCYARGSWKSGKKGVRAVAICKSRRKWKHVIRRWSGRRRSGWAIARCPRGWRTLACTGHSYWMKMRKNAGAFRPRGNVCKARVWGNKHWGATYAICGYRNKSQRRPRRRRASSRKKPHPKGGRGNTKVWRGRKGGRRGGKNPLDEMERTLNRVDRSLRSMERQLKSIQRHR